MLLQRLSITRSSKSSRSNYLLARMPIRDSRGISPLGRSFQPLPHLHSSWRYWPMGDLPRQQFREIGAGYCGIVFQEPGYLRVVKKARYEETTLALQNDFNLQSRVHQRFANAKTLFDGLGKPPRTPMLLFIVSSDDPKWWADNVERLPANHELLRTPVLCSGRILLLA